MWGVNPGLWTWWSSALPWFLDGICPFLLASLMTLQKSCIWQCILHNLCALTIFCKKIIYTNFCYYLHFCIYSWNILAFSHFFKQIFISLIYVFLIYIFYCYKFVRFDCLPHGSVSIIILKGLIFILIPHWPMS